MPPTRSITNPKKQGAPMRGIGTAGITILALQLTYGVAFVVHSSLVVDGLRHFVLFDDAMISMTYARTWVSGEGLVWFPGADPTQGITNPLWTFFMAMAQWLPLPPNLAPLPVQLAGVALVPLTAYAAHGIAHRVFPDLRPIAGVMVLILVGFYLPFYQWSGLGMEAGWITFVLVHTVRCAIAPTKNGRPSPWLFVWLTLGTLTRLDFAVYAAVICGVAIGFPNDGEHRRRQGVLASTAVGASVLFVLLAQWGYYGDPLPNTFALKLGVPLSVRLEAGFASNVSFLLRFSLLLFALALAAPWLRAMERRNGALLFGLVAVALAYNLYAGGDAWEWGPVANRFVLPVVPLLFILLVATLDAGLAKLRLDARVTAIAFAALCALVSVRVHSGADLDPSAIGARWKEAALRAPLLNRAPHDLPYLKAGLLLREATLEPLRVAVSSAGITPWVLGRGTFIDLLGKSDRHVAHTEPKEVPFIPGHVKWDLPHSIDRLDPDVCLGTWCRRPNAYPEPMVVIAGPYNLYVKRRVLEQQFVSLTELHALYRRLDYGSDREFFLGLLDLRGFGFAADGDGFDMAGRGELVFPATGRLSFDMHPYGSHRVHVYADERRIHSFALRRGESLRETLEGKAGMHIRFELDPPPGAGAGGRATVRLTDFMFE